MAAARRGQRAAPGSCTRRLCIRGSGVRTRRALLKVGNPRDLTGPGLSQALRARLRARVRIGPSPLAWGACVSGQTSGSPDSAGGPAPGFDPVRVSSVKSKTRRLHQRLLRESERDRVDFFWNGSKPPHLRVETAACRSGKSFGRNHWRLPSPALPSMRVHAAWSRNRESSSSTTSTTIDRLRSGADVYPDSRWAFCSCQRLKPGERRQ